MLFIKKISKRTKKNLKRFNNAKFDYKKYLKDFYMENGNAYISVNVTAIDDIISKYSIEEYEWLRKEFAGYIEKNAYYIPVEYPIVIEICGCSFTEKEKDLITEVIHDYFGLKLMDAILELENNKTTSIKLLFGSLVVLGIVFLLQNVSISSTFAEFISILFWFFTWEFAESAWLERTELKTQKLEAGQLAIVKVVFEKKSK